MSMTPPTLPPLVRLFIAAALVLMIVQILYVRVHVSGGEVDFGEVSRGAVIRHSFELVNSGLRDLTVQVIEPSCGLRSNILPGTVVGGRSQRAVEVTVDTMGAPDGPRQALLLLRTDDPLGRTLSLTLKFRVRSEFTLSSPYLNLSADRPSAATDFRAADGTAVHVTGVRATDPRVDVWLARTGDGTRINATTEPDYARGWDLGVLLVSTSSSAYPEIRIPVRGGLASVD